MPEPEYWQLLLAAALPAPCAFRLGSVVRDGRELLTGTLYLALGGGTDALVCFLSGSLLLAVAAALALAVLLAHARFLGAHRAPCRPAGEPVSPAAAAAPESGPVSPAEPPPDPLQAGMAGIGDLLESADRLGELRHRRRLRKLEWERAEREAAAGPPQAAPKRRLPQVRRDDPLGDFPRLPPPADKR